MIASPTSRTPHDLSFAINEQVQAGIAFIVAAADEKGDILPCDSLNFGEVSVPVGLSPSISLLATRLSRAFSISNLAKKPSDAGPRLNAVPVVLQSPVICASEVPYR